MHLLLRLPILPEQLAVQRTIPYQQVNSSTAKSVTYDPKNVDILINCLNTGPAGGQNFRLSSTNADVRSICAAVELIHGECSNPGLV